MKTAWQGLKQEKDFQQIRRAGRVWRGQLVRMAMVVTDSQTKRVGIVVTKKISSKAVERNLIRRRIKSILSKLEMVPEKSVDLVIIPSSAARQASFEALAAEIQTGWQSLEKPRGN